jgi:RNA polymerase sigma-70 factor, ECF subfamily
LGPSLLQLNTLTLEEIIGLAQADDMRAVEELVKRVQKNVYITLYQLAPERDDIADMSQDVLLKMCRSIKTLRNIHSFKFWLSRMITHRFYDALRKSQRHLKPVSLDDSFFDEESSFSTTRDVPDTALLPEQASINHELDRAIHEAISSLPEQYRTIVVLREIQGLSYEEIAALLSLNLGTVKSRIARARNRLQTLLLPYIQGTES